MKRFGQLIGLRPERLEEYKRYHAAVWPEILGALRKAEIRNYSIFHFEGRLFAYFEYHGPRRSSRSACARSRARRACASGGTSWTRCRSRSKARSGRLVGEHGRGLPHGMSERFRGKVVIVTAAGSGSGARRRSRSRARAPRCGGRPHRDKAEASRRGDRRGRPRAGRRATCRRRSDCEAARERHRSAFGPLEILVNNAGIGTTGTVLTTGEADFEKLLTVNVKGTYLMSRAAARRDGARESAA
jgi:L-rhamnose mutarotase